MSPDPDHRRETRTAHGEAEDDRPRHNERCEYTKQLIWGAETWVTSLKGCQRWPEGTLLVHTKTGLELLVLEYEIMGFYAGNIEHDGEYLKRFVKFPVYKVRIPRQHENATLADYEMREP